MTGPEHYQQAEQFLARADDAEGGGDWERYYLAAAQVHATLAQAAATAVAGYSDDGMTADEWDAWNAVAGVEEA
jgi:hypothetical protein